MTASDSIGALGGGLDTTHLAAADAQIRAQRARAARANLAALLFEQADIHLPKDGSGPDVPRPSHRHPYIRSVVHGEITELLGMLGLARAPQRQPGHCTCGQPLPLASISGHSSRYSTGQCLTCSRRERAR